MTLLIMNKSQNVDAEAVLSNAVRPLSLRWRDAVQDVLGACGFDSTTAYADSLPQSSLCDLAARLRNPHVSAVRIERLLVEEAENSGTIASCARSLLSRDLRDELPCGWPHDWEECDDEIDNGLFRRAGVFLTLTMALPDRYELIVDRLRRAMCEANIPSGWVPTGPEDPILVEMFSAHWTTPSPG